MTNTELKELMALIETLTAEQIVALLNSIPAK